MNGLEIYPDLIDCDRSGECSHMITSGTEYILINSKYYGYKIYCSLEMGLFMLSKKMLFRDETGPRLSVSMSSQQIMMILRTSRDVYEIYFNGNTYRIIYKQEVMYTGEFIFSVQKFMDIMFDMAITLMMISFGDVHELHNVLLSVMNKNISTMMIYLIKYESQTFT